LAILLPRGFTYHFTFKLKPTIYRNPCQFIKILQTSLFSQSSLSLHATEQLVQETRNCFSPSKEEAFNNYHYSSSEHGNLSFLECHFDAPSDHMQETFIQYLP